MKTLSRLLLLVMLAISSDMAAASAGILPSDIAFKLSSFNPKWNSMSLSGSLESMPLGNGDLTANVWVEQNGDLVFYIGKSDCWSEATRLLKVGRVRVSFDPNPFVAGVDFKEELDLPNGNLLITCKNKDNRVEIRLWADACNPVINVETKSDRPLQVECTTELLRPVPTTFTGGGANPLASSYRGLMDSPTPPSESADRLASSSDNIIWYHRNNSSFFNTILKKQNVGELAEKYEDPYINRTFGAAIVGNDMKTTNDSTLSTIKPVKNNAIQVIALTAQTSSAEDWLLLLDETVRKTCSIKRSERWKQHIQWWNNFWNRSWVFLSGDDQAQMITEGYILQRYMVACQSRGKYPVKFNGGSLTFDYNGQNGDYRNWGPGYWYQNTRFIYWPLTATGDFEMKKPWFDMYLNMLPLQSDITRKYYGHDGAFFPETLNFFGAFIQDDWGWNNTGTASQTRWIRYHYEGALEMLAEMLDYYDHTRDMNFANQYIVPFATAAIRFFDLHWPTINGQYRFIPANALEQYWDCLNPIDYIAALTYDINQLKRLLSDIIDKELQEEWNQVLTKLPPLPRSDDGKKLLPAEEFGKDRNFENPQCYAIWPFKLFGTTQPEYEIALNTFRDRKFKISNCWSQCAVQAARLGLANEMPDLLMHNANARDPHVRFPAFWNPGSDYVPDLDNGGVLMMGVQTMLLDNLDDKMIILQALPDTWEVDFKLNAPQNTIIRTKAKGKSIKFLTVSPSSRLKDIVIPQ